MKEDKLELNWDDEEDAPVVEEEEENDKKKPADEVDNSKLNNIDAISKTEKGMGSCEDSKIFITFLLERE